MAKRSSTPDLDVPIHTGNPAAGLDHGPGDAPMSSAPEGSGPLGTVEPLGGPGASFTMPSGSQGSEESRSAAQKTKDEARNLMQDAKRETANLASQARDQVRDQVQGLVAERKDQMANRLGSLAGVLRDAGRRLNEEDGGGFGRYADRAAEQVDRLSTYLRDRDLDSFMRDTETLARRRPELFLGGTFLAGVLLARFLKASSDRRSGSWAGGTDDRRYSDVHRVGPEELTTPYGPNTHRLDGPDAHAGGEAAYGRP
jgi:hypothetical protein